MKNSKQKKIQPLDTVEPESFQGAWKTAESLKPGEGMMNGCVDGQPHSIAIRNCWQFKPTVTILTPEAFNAMAERLTHTFGA
jgi:hypothetical protein